MLKRIFRHIRNPYVDLTDSFTILVTAAIAGCIISAAADINMLLSVIIIIGGGGISSVIHARLFENKRKNYIRGYAFSVLPVEILSIAALLKYSVHDTIGKCLAVSIALSIAYLAVFFSMSHKHRFGKNNWLFGIHTVTAVCLTPCIISFAAHWTGDKPILKYSSVQLSYGAEYSAEPITADEWADMDLEQKFICLNEVMKAEASALDMADTPVLTAVIYPEMINGAYDRSKDTILINADLMLTSDVYETMNCLGHELYHRYEYILADDPSRNVTGTSEERIKEYRYDLENSAVNIFDWDSYYNSSIETDARAMGEYVADKYVLN